MRAFETVTDLRNLVGQEVGVSDWLVASQDMINAFADVTGDRQWIHCDPIRAARESPYRKTVAHGFLTVALLSRLHHETITIKSGYSRIINYGLNRVRFPSPVVTGSRIRARFTLHALEDIEGGLHVTWLVTVDIEGQTKPAMVAEWLVRFYT